MEHLIIKHKYLALPEIDKKRVLQKEYLKLKLNVEHSSDIEISLNKINLESDTFNITILKEGNKEDFLSLLEDNNFEEVVKEDFEKLDSELKEILLGKFLKEGEIVTIDNEEYTFKDFPTVYYKRIQNPGCEPGLYKDKTKAILTKDKKTITVPLSKIEYPIDLNNLPKDSYFYSYYEDKLEDLPETSFYEGDVVSIIDTDHPNYRELLQFNQYTICDIDYSENPIVYTVKADKELIKVTEDQLKLVAVGPVKMFYTSFNYDQLFWRDIKTKAEFFILLGRYKKVFNPVLKSYKWNEQHAKELINLGKAHGILKKDENLYLITFIEKSVGLQVATATLIDNLILES